MVRQADRAQVGVAVRDRPDQHAVLQFQQARQHVVVRDHGIARGEELRHRVLDLGGILAGLLEGVDEAGMAQLAEVELEFGLPRQQLQARLAQGVDGEALGHARRVLAQPREQLLFGLQDHGGDGPQRVVEVEQDGFGPGTARVHGRDCGSGNEAWRVERSGPSITRAAPKSNAAPDTGSWLHRDTKPNGAAACQMH